MSNGERTILAGGLFGGLLLGALLMRGGVSADRNAATTVARAEPALPAPSAPPGDAEVDALKRQVAELEKKQLKRLIAELEASDDTPEDRDEPQPPPESAAPGAAPDNVARTRRPGPAASAETAVSEPVSPRKKPVVEKTAPGSATLAWWNAVNDVISRESAMRVPPASVTAENAAGFIEARLKAGRFASVAISELDTTGVDAEAVALGRELTAWYQEEARLNERAGSLLGSSSIAERKGAGGNAWRSGEEQHRKKCDEINRKGADLRSRLSRKYSLAFPPLN